MTDPVAYELDGRVARITMDDGKANAFSPAMLTELHSALNQAERDRAVVLLTGREGRFSGGFDLKVFAAGDLEALIGMLRLGATLVERVLSFATPVVVAINGHAVAAGSFLPLAADARIGTRGPYLIGLNEVKIGLTVPYFVLELARQRLQPAHFDRAVVTAAMYSPEEAVAAGFLDEVVSPDRLQETARATAERLADLNPEAHAATKLRVRGPALAAIRTAIEGELTVESFGSS